MKPAKVPSVVALWLAVLASIPTGFILRVESVSLNPTRERWLWWHGRTSRR